MPAKKESVRKSAYAPEKRSFLPIIIILVVAIAIIASAILFGKSDKGEIDVNKAIQEANQKRIDSGDSATQAVPQLREGLRNKPNGGLVPVDPEVEAEISKPKVEESVASSTEDSTEETEDTEVSDEATEETSTDEQPTEDTAPLEEVPEGTSEETTTSE